MGLLRPVLRPFFEVLIGHLPDVLLGHLFRAHTLSRRVVEVLLEVPSTKLTEKYGSPSLAA